MADPIAASTFGVSVVNKVQEVVSKWVTRKDLAEDNFDQLGRIKRLNDHLKVQTPRVEQLLQHDNIGREQLHFLMREVEKNFEALSVWEPKIHEVRRRNRVRRMRQILDPCEQSLNNLSDFVMDKSGTDPPASSSGQDIYRQANTVPPNPPRLLLEFNDPSTCEGKLKAAVLRAENRRVVGIVASGKGGVGKTCALRGLAEEMEIMDRFGGGILYIQLGNDATINDIISGVASIVNSTGGEKLSDKIKNCDSLQEACREAAHWFRNASCLFLIDDIWHRNGITSQVLTVLATMVNTNCRLVYSSRDKHFLRRAHEVVKFDGTEPDSEKSRKMLLLHGGFSNVGDLDNKNLTAFEKILHECKGLPLAFGISGGVVYRLRDRQEEGREQDAWSDVSRMMSSSEKLILLRENAEQYGGLNRMVDVSLNVLEVEYGAGKYKTMFRALCVLQKQQRAPVAMLQKLWNLDSLEEAERAAEILDEVSVLQLRKHCGMLCVQLHDLVLDIARQRATETDETVTVYRTLLGNYAASGEDWWNIGKDGYLHDNLCRLMRCAGNGKELLQLLSEPKWIVHRLLEGGIISFEQDLEEGMECATDGADDSKFKEYLEMVGKAARLGSAYFQGNEREMYFQLYGRLLMHANRNEATRMFLERFEECAPRPWVKASMGLLQQAGIGALEVIPSGGKLHDVQYGVDTISFIWSTSSTIAGVHHSTITKVSETVEYAIEDLDDCRGAAFLRNGRFIASAHQDDEEVSLKIMLWDVEAGKREQVVELKEEQEFSEPQRRRWRGMWSACLGKRKGSKPQQDGAPLRGRGKFVGFCMQGTRFATAQCHDFTIQIWNTESGAAVVEPLRGHTNRVKCVAVSADGRRIVSGSYDHTVRVWDMESGAAVGEPLRGHTGTVWCVAVSADGRRIVSGSVDHTVRVWDTESGAAVGEPLRWHTDLVRCVAVSADGRHIVSGSGDRTVRVWDTESGAAVGEPLRGHTDWVEFVAVSADGRRIVSGSVDHTVRVWDTESGAAVGEPLRGHTACVFCEAVSADGRRIVSGSDDRTVRVWDTESGAAVGEPLRGHTGTVWCVAVSADGTRIVSGSVDRTVRVWDTESGAAVGEPLRGHTDLVICVAVSADGTRIVSGSIDQSARVRDVRSGKQIGPSLMHERFVESVELSADGSRVVTRCRRIRVLWDALSGERLLTSDDDGWQSTVRALGFPPPLFGAWTRRVTDRRSDGSEIVLATCEVEVRNVDGSDVYWADNMDSCKIIR